MYELQNVSIYTDIKRGRANIWISLFATDELCHRGIYGFINSQRWEQLA